jgi:hypothetical protein
MRVSDICACKIPLTARLTVTIENSSNQLDMGIQLVSYKDYYYCDTTDTLMFKVQGFLSLIKSSIFWSCRPKGAALLAAGEMV